MLTLTNARLVDPEGDRVFPGGLVVRDGPHRRGLRGDRRPGIDCGGRHLAPGIIDIGVKVGEPGERHKESFRTAGAAAAAGGVTTIVTRPDTLPAIDTPETLEFLQRRAVATSPVNVLPMAALDPRPRRPRDDRDRLPDGRRCRRLHGRPRGRRRPGLPALPDLRRRPRRPRPRPPAGAQPHRGHLRHLRPVRLPARPARRPTRSPSASASSATSRSSRRPASATTSTS